jgi:hypothetical protein
LRLKPRELNRVQFQLRSQHFESVDSTCLQLCFRGLQLGFLGAFEGVEHGCIGLCSAERSD